MHAPLREARILQSVDAVGVMVGAGVSCGVGVLVGTFIARSSSIGAVGGMSGTIADDGVATAGGTVFLGLSTLSLDSLNSLSSSSSHTNGLSGFSRCLKGCIRSAMLNVYATWLTSPNVCNVSGGGEVANGL